MLNIIYEDNICGLSILLLVLNMLFFTLFATSNQSTRQTRIWLLSEIILFIMVEKHIIICSNVLLQPKYFHVDGAITITISIQFSWCLKSAMQSRWTSSGYSAVISMCQACSCKWYKYSWPRSWAFGILNFSQRSAERHTQDFIKQQRRPHSTLAKSCLNDAKIKEMLVSWNLCDCVCLIAS